MQGQIDKIYGYLLQYGVNLLAAVLIFFIGRWVAKMVANILEKFLLNTKIEKTIAVFTRNVVYFGILTFVVIAALNKLGIETNSFLAIIGAAGLAVGLALQGSLSNFAAGVMMILFQPFQVDDYIEAGGGEGTVIEIQIFNTVLISKDNKRVIIPNAKVTGDKITVYPKSE